MLYEERYDAGIEAPERRTVHTSLDSFRVRWPLREEAEAVLSHSMNQTATHSHSPDSMTKDKACLQIITLFLVLLLYYYNFEVEMKYVGLINIVDGI